ncbi:MAG: DUF1874 domain-containing protein [Syntrophomonadaceae bacterium]|jgi:hypothetical protein|nr:DUF1874 domain-containing protein [Syntrophomonadaceae bacterium]
MRYLLNSAVITDPGRYDYRLISETEMVGWVRTGSWASHIGYQDTAKHIHAVSGIMPNTNRKIVAMKPGDEALVVRLKYRVQDPSQKGAYQPDPDDWEYGILQRIE